MSQRTARSHQTAAFEHSPQYAGSVRTLRSAKEPAKQAAKEPIKHAAKRSAHGADPHDYAKAPGRVGGSAYTIGRAGKQVRFGPVAFWIAVGTVVIMAAWSLTSATYLAFRDDVLRSLIARQAEQQFAY